MRTNIFWKRIFTFSCGLLCAGVLTGCAMTLREQPRFETYEASTFFADGASARPQVADTVARGQLHLDEHLYAGRLNGRLAETFPFPVTAAVLKRGQERYDIYCTPCHGAVGDGTGIVTEYGMRQPTSFHDPDLIAEPVGYYFDLISNGTRVMPSYASRIKPADRWAIVAYIRALQLSQNANLADVPDADRPQLDQAGE